MLLIIRIRIIIIITNFENKYKCETSSFLFYSNLETDFRINGLHYISAPWGTQSRIIWHLRCTVWHWIKRVLNTVFSFLFPGVQC